MRCKKYCSRECAFEHKVGENSNAWKGSEASYSAIHKWAHSKFGKPNICIECGTKGKRMNWANLSRKYLREQKDWVELCAKCHKYFDTRNENDRNNLTNKYLK